MYKLVSPANIFLDDILEVVCRNRGIKNIEKIKNPSPNDLIHYSKLINIDKAVKIFNEYAKFDNVDIGIICDTDVDGNFSAGILTMYLNKHFPNIKIHHYFHDKKQHGITENAMKWIKKNNQISLLFVPDAGSNNFKEHEELYNNNIAVIVLDHHTTEKESEYAIVVNNQISPEYPNKQLSGTGVTYKFLQALDSFYGFNGANEYLDLVGISIISDIMSLVEPENRYLVYNGLKNIKNDYIKEMIFKTIGKYERVYPHTLSFNFIPKTNAIIRFSSMEDKIDLFKAIIGSDETFYNSRTKKVETLPQKVARISINAHKRQNEAKKKWMKVFREQIEKEKLNNNRFIIVKVDKEEKFDNELTGVLASALTSEYRKPSIVLHYNKKENLYTGSLRGYDGVLKNTKEFLTNLNLFETIEGHEQAAGCSIKEENLKKINEVINNHTLFNNLKIENIKEVDFIIPYNKLNNELINNVYSYERYWGKDLEMPLFAITDVEVNVSHIKISENGLIEWLDKGIKYVQFTGGKDFIKIIKESSDKILVLDIVGILTVNHFLGNTSPQVIIEDVKVKEVKEKKIGFEYVW